MERLEWLKTTTESETYAEVFRNALRIYQALIIEAEAGNEFLIRRQDGTTKALALFTSAETNTPNNPEHST